MGSNMAENHPVGFQWVMEARERGADVIHVDPRFSRTSASATQFARVRAGTDIEFDRADYSADIQSSIQLINLGAPEVEGMRSVADRDVDHMLIGKRLRAVESAQTLDRGTLSDHLPLVVTLDVEPA